MCSILKTIGKIQQESDFDYPTTKGKRMASNNNSNGSSKVVGDGSLGRSSKSHHHHHHHHQHQNKTVSPLVPTHHHYHETQQQQQIFRPASLTNYIGRPDSDEDRRINRNSNNYFYDSQVLNSVEKNDQFNHSNTIIIKGNTNNYNMTDLQLVQYSSSNNNINNNQIVVESPMSKTEIEMITHENTTTTIAVNPIEGEEEEEPCFKTHIGNLFPEILTEIFSKLPIKDLGNVARTCKTWRDVLYDKKLWRGVEAKIHLKKSGNQLVYQTLNQRGIKKIQVLSLKRSLRELTTSLPGIQSLKLVGCYNVTDISINSTFSIRLENLKTLNLSLCKQVSDFSLGRIAMMAPNLETLELGGCCQISNRGLLLISWGLKRLTRLNLRSCYLITDTGIGFLAGVVTQSHLQEQKMQDFLVKLGLVNGPQQQDCSRSSNSSGNIGMNAQQQQQFLYLQQQQQLQQSSVPMLLPSHIKKSRLDSNNVNNTNLPVQVVQIQQQCAICKQDISIIDPNNNNGRGRKRSRTQMLISNSSNIINNNNNSNNNPENMNNRLINNTNSNSTTNSVFMSSSVEKITSKTEFGCKNLQHLNLQDCQKLSDPCLVHLTNLPMLESINLSFCVHVSDQGLKSLGSVPKLKEINLRACDNISDQGLANLSYELGSRISSLDVSFCDKIGNLGLNYVAQFHNLRTLSMSACNEISDEGLVRISSSIPNLETLNIGQCSRITDVSMNAIAEKCQSLKYIDLYGLGKISPQGLAKIMTLPKLENLNLGLWHLPKH